MTRLVLHHGDCVAVLRSYGDGTVGGVVSDPPYGLRFMSKAFDDLGDGASQREWHKAWLAEAFRVLRPGGVIKAFSGTRTFHHLGAAMADVGFVDVGLEAWTYGSGFPKSKNIALFLDKAAGAVGDRGRAIPTASLHLPGNGRYAEDGEQLISNPVPPYVPVSDDARRWEGWGTALKPAWEPVLIGRKPL
jgi:site-specific DNA-methyltransferase (adenine-specific)